MLGPSHPDTKVRCTILSILAGLVEPCGGGIPRSGGNEKHQNADALARRFLSMASVSVPVSVNEDQAKAMAKKVGTAALDAGKKAPCP